MQTAFLPAAAAAMLTITAAAPTLAAAPVTLPGVADEETTIRSGRIADFHRGNGDVLFVRDSENSWYRLALNRGCIAGQQLGERMAFEQRDLGNEINAFTRITFTEAGISCSIDSIRRSAAPPQVDSASPITLD